MGINFHSRHASIPSYKSVPSAPLFPRPIQLPKSVPFSLSQLPKMAKISLPNHSFILLALLLAAAFSADADLGGGIRTGLVGGIKEIKNVKENAYVQSLGKFSVDEANKSSGKQPSAKEGPLKFIEVFKAEQQVVAGMKYFLHIYASLPTGGEGTFDAEVVVPPGMKSKQLVNFKRVGGGK